MRYVLAQSALAEAAGFDRATHNTVTVDGTQMMVITAKGMNAAPKLTGSEEERLEALKATVHETQKELEAYLYNKQQEEQQ